MTWPVRGKRRFPDLAGPCQQFIMGPLGQNDVDERFLATEGAFHAQCLAACSSSRMPAGNRAVVDHGNATLVASLLRKVRTAGSEISEQGEKQRNDRCKIANADADESHKHHPKAD